MHALLQFCSWLTKLNPQTSQFFYISMVHLAVMRDCRRLSIHRFPNSELPDVNVISGFSVPGVF